MKKQLIATEAYTLNAKNVAARIMLLNQEILDLIKKGEIRFVVHIPANWPDQIPVKSKLNKSLRQAYAKCLIEFKKKNGKHPQRGNFRIRPRVFICFKDSSYIVGLDIGDAKKILEHEGVKSEELEKYNLNSSPGIWTKEHMPDFWHA